MQEPPKFTPDDTLRADANSFRQLAEDLPGALYRYRLNVDGNDAVEYMSPRCIELCEVPPEVIQRDAGVLWRMVDAEDRPRMQASVARSAQTLEPWFGEWRITTPSGRRKWLEGRGRPERLADGSTVWHSLVFDVSERHRVDAVLHSSEKRLADLLDVSGEGVWEWDIAAGRISHNRRWCEMLGAGDDHLEHGLGVLERFVHPDDWPALMASVQRCLDEGVPQHSEYRMRRTDGRLIWVEDRSDVVERDAAGKPLRMVGGMVDITARKLAELDLRIKDAAIESSLNGIALADLDGRLTYVNPAFCRLWGIAPQDALGRSAVDFWRVRDDPEQVIQALRQQGHWRGEMDGVSGNGQVFTAEVSASMVLGPDGRPLCMMGSFVDVTERNQARDGLRRLNDQLEQRIAQRTDELQRAKAEAERANRAKSEFLSSMSHELRTPMNAVLGFGQLLEMDETLSARSRAYVHELLRGGHHLLELINELLDLARVEAGRIPLSLEPVALAPLLDESRALLAPLAAARAVSLRISPPAAGAAVQADRIRLKQVLVNLLANAIKYNHHGGEVAVRTEPAADGAWRLSVQDTGPGIAADKLPQLFTPYHRLGNDAAAVEGTGIGLVITRRLVELMGGRIGVHSEAGRGTTFWIELPAATLAQAPVAPPVAHAHEPPPRAAAGQTILYVDDNPANLKLMAEMLALQPGLELLTAHTPGLGLDLALAHRPALILLDLQMPVIDGFQLLQRLRAEPTLSAVPVVAVTGLGTERDLERGRDAGFADYIVKPIVLGELLRIVAQRLGRAAAV
ncbi:MAG: PAS domain S-box protein [Aquabacterium sp.]|nr:PAS domain S-box protein [Aquabacterium sp.]